MLPFSWKSNPTKDNKGNEGQKLEDMVSTLIMSVDKGSYPNSVG